MASSFLVHREERIRKDGPNKVRVKKCPVDTFLVRGRVHRRKTASRRDVGFLLFLFTECCWQVLETAGRWLICKRVPSGVPLKSMLRKLYTHIRTGRTNLALPVDLILEYTDDPLTRGISTDAQGVVRAPISFPEVFVHGGPLDIFRTATDMVPILPVRWYHAIFRKILVDACSDLLNIGFPGGPHC